MDKQKVEQILESNGFESQNVHEFTPGRVNDVFYFEHNTHKYVAKISTQKTQLEKEYRLLELLNNKQIPVPSLIYYNFNSKYNILIVSYEETLQNKNRWGEQDFIINTAHDLGYYTKDIHKTSTKKVSKVFTTGNKIYSYINTVKESIKQPKFTEYSSEVEYVIDYFENESLNRSLIHGDVHPDNIGFRENGKVDCIIDWDSSTLSSPCVELGKAEVLFFDIYTPFTPYSMNEIQEVFRTSYQCNEKLEERIDMFKIIYYIRSLRLIQNNGTYNEWNKISNKEDCLNILKSNLNELINNLLK